MPLEPRDSSRLLHASTGTDHVFADLPGFLQPGDLVVVNDTRVRAARLRGRKETEGAVEMLLLGPRPEGSWTALVRPARRLRAGSRIDFGDLTAELISDPAGGLVEVCLDADDVESAIAKQGEMPLPPYITTRLDDPERYQTMFASQVGSAAAPTAGLHFTPRVVGALEARGVRMASIELRVGLGTFRPVAVDRLEDHVMHAEWLSVPPETVEAVITTKAGGGRVIAVGTTVVRALESRAVAAGKLEAGEGETSLFITPGFRFAVVDRLVTNFHLPGSSLIAMVAAFMGDTWRDAYETALARGYRFLSFGDAMLADRKDG